MRIVPFEAEMSTLSRFLQDRVQLASSRRRQAAVCGLPGGLVGPGRKLASVREGGRPPPASESDHAESIKRPQTSRPLNFSQASVDKSSTEASQPGRQPRQRGPGPRHPQRSRPSNAHADPSANHTPQRAPARVHELTSSTLPGRVAGHDPPLDGRGARRLLPDSGWPEALLAGAAGRLHRVDAAERLLRSRIGDRAAQRPRRLKPRRAAKRFSPPQLARRPNFSRSRR